MKRRDVTVILILTLLGATPFLSQQLLGLGPQHTYTIVSDPLLDYADDAYYEYAAVRDVWNESFEEPFTTENHDWYQAGLTVAEGAIKRNSTLDPGFEEVTSSSLNPNVNLPSWFIQTDSDDITVTVARSGTIKYAQSYSAYVETRYINTTTTTNSQWQTPFAIYQSCASLASLTIDDNTGTEWTHKSTERHWVIYNLNQSYVVKEVRVYSGSNRIDDVDIYVSDDPGDFGMKVVEFWDPVNASEWSESPNFFKEGQFIKLEFGTTHFKDEINDAFYEFDAYIQVSGAGHVGGGLRSPEAYYVRIPSVFLNASPSIEAALFLDDAGLGSGYFNSIYSLIDVEIRNTTSSVHLVYVVPITTIGDPSSGDFTNTTSTKFLYNVTEITGYDIWKTFSRNVTSDYEALWGEVEDLRISQVTVKNSFLNPQTDSATNTPYMKAYYDSISVELASQGNEEELPNGGFEAPGWTKLQENQLASFNYTKTGQDAGEQTTGYLLNVTSDTSGGSGAGFNATKHGVVALSDANFIREINSTSNNRLHGFIQVVNHTGTPSTDLSYVGIRVQFINMANQSDIRYLIYAFMLYGNPPPDTDTEKYVELVKFYALDTEIWYEISRRPIMDGGWTNVKIGEIALVAAFYYGLSYESTDNDSVVALFDFIGIDYEEEIAIIISESVRSDETALDGNYALKQNRTASGVQFDVYEGGAENANNSFYVAFPYYMNLSVYHYVAALTGDATIQISLAIDDGPIYGKGYLYELIYYYGSPTGVTPFFVSAPQKQVELSASITTLTWIHTQRNWTMDVPATWPLINPRVEAVAVKIWTTNTLTVFWDLAAFYGTWYGMEKRVRFQSINEILINKLNSTETWNVIGGMDEGIDDYVDNNVTDIDGVPDKGSHANFTLQQAGPDYLYDILTEAYSDQFLTNTEDYVDNDSSDVDDWPDKGYHDAFTDEQMGPDSIYDLVNEEDMGMGIDVHDYVDYNASDVDDVADLGSHGNFTAEQAGPDAGYDTLTETNIYPPPNDVVDYVDYNASDVDISPDVGGHSNFTAQQYGPDLLNDTLTEANTNPSLNDVIDYVDTNITNVDGVSNLGTHSNFTAEQGGPDLLNDTLTEEFTGSLTTSTEDFVDQLSDVDGVTDLGSHGNFTAEQAGPDASYDTLTEEQTVYGNNDWTTPSSVYDLCGEENNYEGNETIDDDNMDDWRHSAVESHWIVYDLGQSMKVTKVRIYSGVTPQQYTVEDITVYVSMDTVFDESEKIVTDWDVPKGGWDISPTFSAVGRYIKIDTINVTTSNRHLSMAFYEFDVYTEPLYELDLEVQFTTVNYNEINEELSIYAGTQGAENLRVDVWNGTGWENLIADVLMGWNNVSVTGYLMNATFTIRFKGSSDAEDTSEDTYELDAVLLHVWTPGISNHELDREVRFTDVDYDEINEELSIYAGDLTSESLQVDAWTGSDWSTLIASLTANSWNNVSVTLTDSNFTIRFKGTDESADDTADSWQLDAVLLHVWTAEANYKLDLEVQWTTVDYDEVNEELCIYAGNVSAEDLLVQAWTQSGWVTLFLELTANAWNNISVTDYATEATFTIRFKGNSEIGDTEMDSWQLDAVLLHLFSLDEINYELLLEVQFTDVDYDEENEELCIYTGDLSSEDLRVDVWVQGSSFWQNLHQDLTANSWNNISIANHLVVSNFTLRFRGANTSDSEQDSWQLDAVLLHVWTEGGHQLDLEVQWTGTDHDEENEELCIYTGDLSSEDLRIDVWTGSSWVALANLTANSWNNISVANYLNNPTFTIRFKGIYEYTEDDTADSWQLDAVLLHVWTFEGYMLDLEVQFTDVETEYRAGEFRIYAGSLSGETLRVYYWADTGWETLIPVVTANGWSTAQIPLNETVTVRFKGNLETDDFTQNSWHLDVVLLHTWYVYATETISQVNATVANQWYYKWWGYRTIVVVNGTDSYELNGNSTAAGLLAFHDADWEPETNTTIYANDTSGSVTYNVTDLTLTDFGKNLEYQEYVEVRYTVLFCRPLGVFKFESVNRATAANEPDEYGEEYWMWVWSDGVYLNYMESESEEIVTYLPDF